MGLNVMDYVTILAVSVAGLSALYARWVGVAAKNATIEAKRANEISLLSRRIEIYDAYIHLKMHMLQKRGSAESSEVSKFYYSSLSAKAFFKAELADDINNYYDACFWIADINSKNEGNMNAENREQKESFLKKEQELSKSLDKDFVRIFRAIHN